MREIGKLPELRYAQRLADYLLTLGIRSRVDPGPAGATLWVYDEDRRDEARRAFDEFQANPADPRYERAAQEARRLAAEAAAQESRYRKNVVDMRRALAIVRHPAAAGYDRPGGHQRGGGARE